MPVENSRWHAAHTRESYATSGIDKVPKCTGRGLHKISIRDVDQNSGGADICATELVSREQHWRTAATTGSVA